MAFRVSKVALPVLILGFAVLVAMMLIKTKAPAMPVAVKEKAWLVDARPVTPGLMAPVLTLYGRVESLWSSQLTAGIAAEVQQVKVIEGDSVEAGQVMIVLDDRDARLQLAQREAELQEVQARMESELSRHAANEKTLPREQQLLNLTRAEVTRLRDLVKKKVGAQSQLDTARQAVERQAIAVNERELQVVQHSARLAELKAQQLKAKALRDQAHLEVERCQVKAPFSGRVSQVLVSPGRRVRLGDVLLEVFDTGNLLVRAQIPSNHLVAIQRARDVGAALTVSGEIDGVVVSARLLSLAGQVSAATGGVEALFAVDTSGTNLQQGRFVRLDLSLPEQDDMIALPHEALYGGERIYRIDTDSRMRALQVERFGETLGVDGRKQVLLRSPQIEVGDRIVTTQLPNAISGLLVRVPQTLPAETNQVSGQSPVQVQAN